MKTNDSNIVRFVKESSNLLRTHWANICNDYNDICDDKWEFFYAIDADIFALFLNPIDKFEYAYTFTGMKQKTDTLLARRLGDFIFDPNCTNSRPIAKTQNKWRDVRNDKLLIISPHDEEIQKYVLRIIKDFNKVVCNTDLLITQLVTKIKNQDTDEDSVNWILDYGYELLEIFDGRSGNMLMINRLVSIDGDSIIGINQYYRSSDNFTFKYDDVRYNGGKTIKEWSDLLEEHKAWDQNREQIERDAKVLWTLQQINRELFSSKKRLILITGTASILEATENVIITHPSNDNKTVSFADMYIRHPVSFIMDKEFFSIPSDSSDKFDCIKLYSWMNNLYPKQFELKEKQIIIDKQFKEKQIIIDKQGLKTIENKPEKYVDKYKTLIENLVNILENTEDNNNGNVEDIGLKMVRHMEHQINNMFVRYEIISDSERAIKFVQDIVLKIRNNYSIKEIKKDLLHDANVSLEAIATIASTMGVWNQMYNSENSQYGIPALRFDNKYENAQERLDQIVQIFYKEKEDVIDQEAIKKIYTDLKNLDDRNYHSLLIHAFIFACYGHWYATKTLCLTALNVAESFKIEEIDNMCRGREAAYLLAVAERRLVKKEGDMLPALSKARNMLIKASYDYEDDDALRRKHIDIRFRSERLAIDVTELNYNYFSSTTGEESVLKIPYLLEKISEGMVIQEELEKETSEKVKAWVNQQSLVNLLSLALFLYYLNKNNKDLEQKYRNIKSVFCKVKNILEKRFSCLNLDMIFPYDNPARFISITGLAIFSDAPERKNGAKEFLNGNNPNIFLSGNIIYDEPREKFLRKLVNDAT